MSTPGRTAGECFVCRIMRAFGVTGLGALLGGFGTLALGAPRPVALWSALIGGLISASVYLRGEARR